MERYDLVIIGGGAAAFAAALKASEFGAQIAMIEKGILGGTCVNVGCVPTKFLLTAAERYHLANQNRFNGIKLKREPLDFAALIHIFPALSEAIKLSAQSFKRDISKMSCCVE